MNKSTKTGDVIVNGGYSCGYQAVLLVIYPYKARRKPQDERQADLERAYKNVLLVAARDKQIHTVVTTLFGIESNNDDEIKFAANCFLKSYLEYCKQKLIEKDSFQKEVTIVCQTEHAHSLVCEVFMKYVQDQKDKEMEKTSVSGNPQDDTKASAGELEDCVICLDGIKEPKRLDCGHTFCEECIEQHFKFAQKCPTCGHVCGKITGDQPDGTIDVYVNRFPRLTGYNSYETIVITYTFQDGKQREDHPNPGKWYKGIQRRAYLPNNKEGRKIAKMLKVAFERKLVFTIGSSRTTGQEGVITWNDIHHKTDSRPHTQFGYPDPTYLERVKDELAAKGVTENDITDVTL
ncbi:E3 ubiquitin-protein ligase DTX3L-like [Ruditapes philippinarum]|uniref:E3 ubiquitin-protein ligase DTX3L-like n=1 Tax=Ruditapes philippinarum TaxID=129788 RepID=UPI00295AF433|nr:E3 ubiquitin-protein ligase DTX3L-like [Ruditapes philippinarum]